MRKRQPNPMDGRRAYAVFLLMQAPRTATELADLMECTPVSALRWLAALEAEALVKRDTPRHPSGRGLGEHVFTWVGLGDASKPLP